MTGLMTRIRLSGRSKKFAQDPAVLERGLGGSPDAQGAVTGVLADAGGRFHGHVLHKRGVVFFFKDKIGLRQPLLDIPLFPLEGLEPVRGEQIRMKKGGLGVRASFTSKTGGRGS